MLYLRYKLITNKISIELIKQKFNNYFQTDLHTLNNYMY